jgi:hypothetical protein
MVDWQSPQVSARTPACLRDSAKKMPNGEPLGINFWWWGGTLRQTYVTQRLRTAANSCGKVQNPAPAANNRINFCRRRHQQNTLDGRQFDSRTWN